MGDLEDFSFEIQRGGIRNEFNILLLLLRGSGDPFDSRLRLRNRSQRCRSLLVVCRKEKRTLMPSRFIMYRT